MHDADYIVIGSGHNGLTSALKLAQAGKTVLICERAEQPGGACKSAEITLPGFIHDLYASNIGLFLGSDIYQEFRETLHQHGLEIATSDHPFANLFPDGDGIGVYQDAQKTDEQFRRQSERDADAWHELLRFYRLTSPYFLPLLKMPLPSLQAMRQLYRLLRGIGYRQTLELANLLIKTPRQFSEYWFTSPKVQALFIPWGLHLDYGPDIAAGAQFPFIEAANNYINGMSITKGGISNLIHSMVKSIEQAGGKLLLNQGVKRVLLQGDQATGVETEEGTRLYAREGVIANATPTQLITKLISQDRLPAKYVRRVRRYRYGPGTMMIHLALDGPPAWEAGEDFQRFAYIHIGPYAEDIARTYTEAINGALPSSPLLIVGQQSAVDPSRAPAGKHTLWVQVRALPTQPRSDALDEIEIGPWDTMKEAYADRVINKLATYAPNIHDIIQKRVVFSPADLEKANPNLVGGDSVAGSHHLDQNFLFRPIPGWSRYTTPIKRLYLVGASTWPGGGLNATSGYLLAKQLLHT